MQRIQLPSNSLQQQYKRQASFGVSNHDSITESNNNNNNSNNNESTTNSLHYYLNELQTVGMRIRQCVDQGYNLLNREKSDLNNASLNTNDNAKAYAGFIVPQYNPTCTSTPYLNDIINNNNNNSNGNSQQQFNSINNPYSNNDNDENESESEIIYLNGKRKYN